MTADVNGDRALEGADGDRLGFAETAAAVAAALRRQPITKGLVVGIEGRWGSGKSSLVNMTLAELRRAENTPIIIEFKPWLVGNRDGLLLALFVELASAVVRAEEAAGNPVERRRHDAKVVAEKIRRFAAKLSGFGKAAKNLGSMVPLAGVLAPLLEGFSDLAKSLENVPSISEEKAKLRKRLAALPNRIIITIDDVDRLEPSEVVEILRLVRSVADFPNVIYVLCYDPSIVAHAIEAAAKVQSGRAYIEKIVQIAFSVPQPEAFDLRRWFNEEINTLPYESDEASGWRSRLNQVIDTEGGRYLVTPRHVVRCLDGIRFIWDSLHNEVDLSDLVWLHLVKVGNARLYEWIEHYLVDSTAKTSSSVHIADRDKRLSRTALDEALAEEKSDFEAARYRLAELLPGIDDGTSFGREDDPSVHTDISKETIATAVRFRRLASPDHARLYFAVRQPRNSPALPDFEALFQALDHSADRTSDLLAQWNRERLSTGATKAEVILSRLVDTDTKEFTDDRADVLLRALADRMDELAAQRADDLGDPQAWIEGRRILRRILLKAHDRQATLTHMFDGRALAWLTTILRSQTFAHGRVDEQRSGEKLLTAEELDLVSDKMIGRYRKLTLGDWKELRRPLSALFAWLQAGDADGPRAMVAAASKTDAGLLDVLEIMGGRVHSSGRGSYVALKESTLTYFMDYADARARTERLARESTDAGIRSRATVLMAQFKDADED